MVVAKWSRVVRRQRIDEFSIPKGALLLNNYLSVGMAVSIESDWIEPEMVLTGTRKSSATS